MSQFLVPPHARPAKRSAPRLPKAEVVRPGYAESSAPVTVRLPWPPSVNHYWRTAVICGRAQTYMSAEGKAYRQFVAAAWLAIRKTFTGRLAVRIDAVMPDNRNRDLDNLCKAVLDALQHVGAFADDSQVKLLIVETDRTEKPGWLDVTIGNKPGIDRQNGLFDVSW